MGTTDPQSKLSVNGGITCKEIEVLATGWPDYVFEEDYDLISLEETEDFIENNKHLPGVPSEKEVEENGLNLGEMDAVLLRKIEEMTLHMINLEKKNQQLFNANQELLERVNKLENK